MKSKGIFLALVAFLIVAAVFFSMKLQLPDLSRYNTLRDPAICVMQSQRVLVVEAKGSPNKVGKKAFGFLMRTYYGLKGVPVGGPRMACPRARFSLPDSAKQSEWIGSYAMPIPDSIVDPKLPEPPPGLSISVATWDYGEVAEILHNGSYDAEKADIIRLQDFIHGKGLVIVGDHEEEYLRGPGMFFQRNPKNYFTIIRYRVKSPDTIAPRSGEKATAGVRAPDSAILH